MKITKQESKLHDEAMAILSLTRKLEYDDIEFVYKNFNPMAENNVGKGGIFFTPLELAEEFAVYSGNDGDLIDFAAGIGILSWTAIRHRGNYAKPRRHVAVELSHSFVEIGKKLLPEVEWIEGDIFNWEQMEKLGEFNAAISNPPYGHVKSVGGDWMKNKGDGQTRTVEMIARMTYCGGYIIAPSMFSDYDLDRREYKNPLPSSKIKFFQTIYFNPIDTTYDEWDHLWKGAAPRVNIIDVSLDNAEFPRPYGFRDMKGEEWEQITLM